MNPAKRESDEPQSNLGLILKWLISLGATATLIAVIGAMIWLFRELAADNRDASRQLIESTTGAINKIPELYAQVLADNRANATYMQNFCNSAHEERMDILKETQDLRKVMQELVQAIREDQRKNAPTVPPGTSG